MVSAFFGSNKLNNLALKKILRNKEEKRILIGKISGIEDEYYKVKKETYLYIIYKN